MYTQHNSAPLYYSSVLLMTALNTHLGPTGALSVPIGGSIARGAGLVWMFNVSCTGSEEKLISCNHDGWGVYPFVHLNDANVICEGKQLLSS